MKVAIVGCGIEGSTLAGMLATGPEISELALVSRDGKRATRLAGRLRGLGYKIPIECSSGDARDAQGLSGSLQNADVLVNAALPDANVAVMRAALSLGAHYLDMVAYAPTQGTPREETLDACLDLHDSFVAADLLGVPNTGASPGLTDLAARHLGTNLEEIHSVTARWADRSDSHDLVGPFTPDQVFSVLLPHPTASVNGVLEEVDLIGSREYFDWPEPIGRMLMFTAAHMPEVATIAAVLPRARRIEVKSGLAIGRWDSWLEIWAEAIRRFIVDPGDRDESIFSALGKGIGTPAEFEKAVETGVIREHGFGISVTVTGTDADGEVARTLTVMTTLAEARKRLPLASPMSHLTAGSTPYELVRALGRGEIEDRGVATSVGALKSADVLVENLAKREFTAIQEVTRAGCTDTSEGWG